MKKNQEENLLAIYDLLYRREKTIIYSVLEHDEILGHLLIYTGLANPIAFVKSNNQERVTSLLLGLIPRREIIILSDRTNLKQIEERFNVSRVIEEDLMVYDPNRKADLYSNLPRRLTRTDAPEILRLYSQGGVRGSETTYEAWIQQHVVYGIDSEEVNGSLVAVGGTRIQIKEGWVISDIYTAPEFRNRGFATMITSALIKDAMRETSVAILYVVSSNAPAIRAYQKVGFVMAGQMLWIDVGTGAKPLGSE